MSQVKFKEVPNFPGYVVGDDGSVFSTKRGAEKPLILSKSTAGYAQVKFSNGVEKKSYQVHRLVAELFIKNKKDFEIVNHIDGDKLNNHISNLEWTTRKGNAKHHVEKLLPKQRAARKLKKDNDMKARMAIINHAHAACTSNPELFYSIYQTVMN